MATHKKCVKFCNTININDVHRERGTDYPFCMRDKEGLNFLQSHIVDIINHVLISNHKTNHIRLLTLIRWKSAWHISER